MNKSKGGVKYQSGRLAPCLGILESYGLCPSLAFSGHRGIDTIYVRPPGKRAVEGLSALQRLEVTRDS